MHLAVRRNYYGCDNRNQNKCKHQTVIKALKEAGADVGLKTIHGETPMDWAECSNYERWARASSRGKESM